MGIEKTDCVPNCVNNQYQKRWKCEQVTVLSIFGLTGCVPSRVQETTNQVNHTCNCCNGWIFQSSNEQKDDKLSIIFQKVLMTSLDAIKDWFGVIVHCRIRNFEFTTSERDLDSKILKENKGSNECDENVRIFSSKHERDGHFAEFRRSKFRQ